MDGPRERILVKAAHIGRKIQLCLFGIPDDLHIQPAVSTCKQIPENGVSSPQHTEFHMGERIAQTKDPVPPALRMIAQADLSELPASVKRKPAHLQQTVRKNNFLDHLIPLERVPCDRADRKAFDFIRYSKDPSDISSACYFRIITVSLSDSSCQQLHSSPQHLS